MELKIILNHNIRVQAGSRIYYNTLLNFSFLGAQKSSYYLQFDASV